MEQWLLRSCEHLDVLVLVDLILDNTLSIAGIARFGYLGFILLIVVESAVFSVLCQII